MSDAGYWRLAEAMLMDRARRALGFLEDVQLYCGVSEEQARELLALVDRLHQADPGVPWSRVAYDVGHATWVGECPLPWVWAELGRA